MSRLVVNGVITMPSRGIVNLVGSRHGHVKWSIERLTERSVTEFPLVREVKNHLSQSVSAYLMGKRDNYVVVMQLSPEFTARLVDHWQGLEQIQRRTIPQSSSEALRLATDLTEQKQQLTSGLAATAPKVELVDRYCTASGSMLFRQMAKLFKAKGLDLRLFLLENDIMYRLGGTMILRYQHIDAGRFGVKTGISVTSNHASSQARFTARGIRWIGGLWVEHIARRQVA